VAADFPDCQPEVVALAKPGYWTRKPFQMTVWAGSRRVTVDLKMKERRKSTVGRGWNQLVELGWVESSAAADTVAVVVVAVAVAWDSWCAEVAERVKVLRSGRAKSP
jgi:hypothetical protein